MTGDRRLQGTYLPALSASNRSMPLCTPLREVRLVSSDLYDLIHRYARKGVTARHYDLSTPRGRCALGAKTLGRPSFGRCGYLQYSSAAMAKFRF